MLENVCNMQKNSAMKMNISAYFLFGVCVLTVAGCGSSPGGPDKRPERVAFAGTAKLNGIGIEEALITFHATSNPGYGASAKTDANGNFVMGTFTSNDGVVPGEYEVTVMKGEIKADVQETISTDDPRYNGAPEETAPVEPINVLPAKFQDPKTSGVKVTVTDADKNFQLEFK